MSSIVPALRPQLTREQALKTLRPFPLESYPVKLLGIRGYYKKTMGNPLTNDRGLYDDALFIVTPTLYKTFNANTDPSATRPGMAVLQAGHYYLYKPGLHGVSGDHPYEALRQYGNVTVVRDGGGACTDNPQERFWIDIHRGSYTKTSSLGCQTVHPDQWAEFMATVKSELVRYGQTIVPYAVVAF